MPNSPTDPIEATEYLFRAITHPTSWDEEKGRPSSAAFKDRNGVSVDRQAERTGDQCITPFLDKFPNLKAIVKFLVSESIGIGAHPISEPLEGNPYHCLLKLPDGSIKLTDSIVKKLRDLSTICHLQQIN